MKHNLFIALICSIIFIACEPETINPPTNDNDTTTIPPTTNVTTYQFSPQKSCALLDITSRNNYTEESGDNSRHLYSAQYMLDIAGVPTFSTTDIYEAMNKANIIVLSSPILSKTFTSTEADSLINWTKAGGVVISPAIINATSEIETLFGISESSYAKTREKYIWNPSYLYDKELEYIDAPEELEISLGKNTSESQSIKTYAYTLTSGEGLAHFDDNGVAVVRNQLGKGAAYSFGILWRDVIQRSQLNKDFNASRSVNNFYEPSGDIYAFFIRSVYAKTNPIAPWKFTVPDGYESLLITTHDCDSRTAYDEMFYTSEYEKSLGLKSHFFLTVHYFRDQNYLSAFYDDASIAKSKQLLKDGHTIGSHSICHFPDFNKTERFPITVVSKEEYTPHHDTQTGITTGGSTWAELALSKKIIESDLGNNVRSFRSGHLCVNKNMPQVLKESNYSFASCYTAGDVLSLFPFNERLNNAWEGEQGILQMPLHISDVFSSDPMDENNWHEKPDIWLDVMNKLKNNYASSIILIHPNRDWKMFVLKQLIEKMDRNKIGLYNFEDYGDFWVDRQKTSIEYDYNAEDGTLMIKSNLSAEQSKACSFAIDIHQDITITKVVLLNEMNYGRTMIIKPIAHNRFLAYLPN